MSDAVAPNGLVVIDKPSGWTSHDVVAKSRGILGTRKVGHAGTLDPMATGVLVLGVGRSTKLLRFLSGLSKTYEATIQLGSETDSLDADGDVTATYDMEAPSVDLIRSAAADLTGDIMQVPPMVSAIKIDGRRLHALAREGKEVAREARAVTVSRFDIVATVDPMRWRATVECSSGTYIRVLAADLGQLLGGGAHLAALRRTAVGPFTLSESQSLDRSIVSGEMAVLEPATIARVLDAVTVGDELAATVAHGRVLERTELTLGDNDPGPWALLAGDGSLLAIYEPHRDGRAKPAVVLVG